MSRLDMFIKSLMFIYYLFDLIKHFIFVLSILGAFIFGYGAAHGEVATECQKLNSFYVGDNVYDCKLRDNKKVGSNE